MFPYISTHNAQPTKTRPCPFAFVQFREGWQVGQTSKLDGRLRLSQADQPEANSIIETNFFRYKIIRQLLSACNNGACTTGCRCICFPRANFISLFQSQGSVILGIAYMHFFFPVLSLTFSPPNLFSPKFLTTCHKISQLNTDKFPSSAKSHYAKRNSSGGSTIFSCQVAKDYSWEKNW